MTGTTWPAALLCAASLLAATPTMDASPAPAIRGLEGLVRAYDAILGARFDQVESDLARACGPAPPEACDVLRATALWWRILIDPENRTLDDRFLAEVEHAIRTTDAWTRRAPREAEAWFYLGGAYAARVQWRVLRNEKLSAARDGKRIKDSMERAIALEPDLDDARFGVGLYQYYADVAPAAVKLLRFLFLLPGGDRAVGLAEMIRARTRGRLLQGEADYQLHVVYLWYEHDTDRALQLLRSLHERYPTNPLFLSQVAEIQDAYQHDLTASLASWKTLLGLALRQQTGPAALGEAQARLGIARQSEALEETDRAIEQLQSVIAARPAAPYSALPLAYLRLGNAQDRLGDRAAAVAAYRAAQSAALVPDPYGVRTQARERLQREPDRIQAEAYRLSLAGWRQLERSDLAAARASLDRSLSLNRGSAVARYRLGRVLQAQRDDARALEQFELAIRGASACPAPLLGAAYFAAARLHEAAGRRDQAIADYRVAATLFGGSGETHAAAARALDRLRVAK